MPDLSRRRLPPKREQLRRVLAYLQPDHASTDQRNADRDLAAAIVDRLGRSPATAPEDARLLGAIVGRAVRAAPACPVAAALEDLHAWLCNSEPGVELDLVDAMWTVVEHYRPDLGGHPGDEEEVLEGETR